MAIKKRDVIFWLAVAVGIISTFWYLDANAAQVCQHGRCQLEEDPEVLQCAARSCELMAEGVYLCEAEVCVDRPDPDGFKPRWAFNLNLRAYHYTDPKPDAPFPEHNNRPGGFGIEFHPSDSLYIALNKFENSYYQDARSLTVGSYVLRGEWVQVGIEAGVADGYEIAGDSLSVPKVTEDIIFVAGIVLRVGPGVGLKNLITSDFAGTQAQYMTGGAP